MMSGIGRSNDDATSIVKDDAEHSFSLLQSGSHHPKRGLGCHLVAWLRVDWVALSCRDLEWIELPSRAMASSELGCCLVLWLRVSWVAVA